MTRSSRSTDVRSTAARSLTACCTNSAACASTPRSVAKFAVTTFTKSFGTRCSARRRGQTPRQRRAPDVARRVPERGDHAAAVAAGQPRRARGLSQLRSGQPAHARTTPRTRRAAIDGAHQFSPKASLAVTPLERKNAQLDVYLNWGHGFHSNDVRGVFAKPVRHAADARGR